MPHPYYNHDHIWQQRRDANSPVWGTYSVVLYERVLKLLRSHTPGPGTLLDIGCGAGQFGELAVAAGYRFIGVDSSAVAIQLGREHRPGLDLHVVDFAEAMACETLGTFSATHLVSLNVLHCLGEQQHRRNFLRQARECAQSGAVFLLTTMVGPLTMPHRSSHSPRFYVSPEQVQQELLASGWDKTLHCELMPASQANPIPNLEMLVSGA